MNGYIYLNENVLVFTETQRKPVRSVDGSFGGQSFSTGSSPSLSHDLHTNDDYEQEEDFHAEVARENSFEDLEQFLTQLDWAPPQGNAEATGSEAELFCEQEQDEQNLQELEMRALKEHLKAIVKDIHIAIGEHGDGGLRLFYISFLFKTFRVWQADILRLQNKSEYPSNNIVLVPSINSEYLVFLKKFS